MSIERLERPFEVRGFRRTVHYTLGDLFHVYKCKTCGKSWSLVYESRSIGSRLHLLNHTAGHDQGAA